MPDSISDAKDRYSSRKFLLVMLSVSMAFLLAMLEKLTPEFSMVISIVVPVYVGGNAYVESRKIKHGGADG